MTDEDGCDRDDRTLYVGGLSEKMTESILYELFFQAGKFFNILFILIRLK